MTPVQLKMARAALDLDVDQLASKAGLSHTEIAQFESGGTDGAEIAGRLRSVFEEAGITLIEDNGVRYLGQPDSGVVALEDLSSANDE